jgi:hypothetical protein
MNLNLAGMVPSATRLVLHVSLSLPSSTPTTLHTTSSSLIAPGRASRTFRWSLPAPLEAFIPSLTPLYAFALCSSQRLNHCCSLQKVDQDLVAAAAALSCPLGNAPQNQRIFCPVPPFFLFSLPLFPCCLPVTLLYSCKAPDRCRRDSRICGTVQREAVHGMCTTGMISHP